jgi:hypothetical protein
MHNTVLRRSQEIRRTTKTIQHATSHDASAVGMCIDIDLHRGIHADHAETSNDLRGVRDLL